MSSINIRESLNLISEVIINRPKPLREFDQIYMRAGDMLLQAEHVSRLFHDREIVFIGDGDSIGLCILHLHNKGVLQFAPSRIHVLDFDERIVRSIQQFAKKFGIDSKMSAELYNVALPLPSEHWEKFDGFYTNPPFGASNGGNSVNAFLSRGIEACKENAVSAVVIADDPELKWTQNVLFNVQKFMMKNSFYVTEQIPGFHSYHLDDDPGLKSCSISFKRHDFVKSPYSSLGLETRLMKNFYGEGIPLEVLHVKDLTNGGKMASRDHKLIRFKKK
jgi:predicted methyltransferase